MRPKLFHKMWDLDWNYKKSVEGTWIPRSITSGWCYWIADIDGQRNGQNG